MHQGLNRGSANKPDSDTVALRQTIVVGFVSFLLGMVGVLILTGWLMWRFVEPDTPWHQLLHIAVYGLIFSVLGGMALAAGTMSLLSWWHYRRGVYRCVHCGRPLKSISILCDCPEVQALVRSAKESNQAAPAKPAGAPPFNSQPSNRGLAEPRR